MIGTVVNAGCIVVGGALGLATTWQMAPMTQQRLKALLGVACVYAGLSAVWGGLNGSIGQVVGQFLVVLAAMIAGRLTGRLFRLQRGLNHLGGFARRQVAAGPGSERERPNEGFVVCTILFCLAPLAVLGPVHEALCGDLKPLLIKSAIDGLSVFALARTFGWRAVLSAVPVLAWQGTLTLALEGAAPGMAEALLIHPVQATSGFLVFSVSLIIFEVRKVEVADYLPSLVYAPLVTLLFR